MQRNESAAVTRSHGDIIQAMKAMGHAVSEGGMCFGASVAAIEYYYSGRLKEFDELKEILNRLLNETYAYLSDKDFTEIDFEHQLEALIVQEDQKLQQQNKLTFAEVFKQIEKYQLAQEKLDLQLENLELENCIVVSSTLGISNIDDLSRYYTSLQSAIDNSSSSTGLACLIGSSAPHAVITVTEPNKRSILFRDINYSNLHEIDYSSSEDLSMMFTALEIFHPDCNYTLHKNLIIIPKSNLDLIKCIKQWQQSDAYKELHILSEDRITRISGNGSSLLSYVTATNKDDNNLSLIKEMFKICPNLAEYNVFPRALCDAIGFGHKTIINFFLEKETSLLNMSVTSQALGYSFTALQCALQCREMEAAEILLAKGAEVNVALHLPFEFLLGQAKSLDKEEDIINLFNEKISGRGDSLVENPRYLLNNMTPLHIAAMMGEQEIVELLLSKDAFITSDSDRIFPYELAEAMGYQEIANIIKKQFELQERNVQEENDNDLGQQQDDLFLNLMEQIQTHGLGTSDEAQGILKSLEGVKGQTSLQQYSDMINLFYGLAYLEQSKSRLVQQKVLNLYSEIDLLLNDITKNQVDKGISVLNEKMEVLNQKNQLIDKLIDNVYQAYDNLSASNSNTNAKAALSYFEQLVADDKDNIDDLQACSTILKTLFNFQEKLQPPRFLTQQKVIHHEWKNLLNDLYIAFIKNADLPSLKGKAESLSLILRNNSNCIFDSISKVPEAQKLVSPDVEENQRNLKS